MTVPREATDEDLLAEVARLADELGKMPSHKDIRARTGVGGPKAARLQARWREQHGLTPAPGNTARGVPDPEQDSARPATNGRRNGHGNGSAVAEMAHAETTMELSPVPRDSNGSNQVNGLVTHPDPSLGQTGDPVTRPGATDPTRQADPGQSTRPDPAADPIDTGHSTRGAGVVGRGETTQVDPAGRPATGKAPKGALAFYAVAVMAIGVSVDTSFRFFGEKLHITGTAQYLLFAVMEAALIACGLGMAHSVRAGSGPGPYRVTAWALCGFAAYAAIDLSGPIEGPARAVLGPVLGLVMLHHALGIDRRAVGNERAGTLTRVARELRERVLSLLGLADDGRDALSRTRERAARRAARLANADRGLFREPRLRRAIRQSNVAHDARQRERMLAELAVLQHVEGLKGLTQESPWETANE